MAARRYYNQAMSQTSLYRHFDEDDKLLYIGISFSAVERLGQHAYGSAWFSSIARVEIEHFENRQTALEAEEKAIRLEKPLHNKSTGQRRHSKTIKRHREASVSPIAVDMILGRLEGKTQAQLARELGIKASYLSDILRGKRAPGPQVLEALGLERVFVYTPRKSHG